MRSLLIALAMLGTSGSAAAQQQVPPAAAAPAYDRAAALDAVAKLADAIEARFVFPETARAYAAMLRGKLQSGTYANIADAATLARTVTADLQAVAPDGHLHMSPQSRNMRPGPPPAAAPGGAAPGGPMPKRPDPIEQAGWIAPGIAYIRFNVFLGGKEAEEVSAFLDQYAGAKTLIIDARTHGGGGIEEMNQLFPRIYAKPQVAMIMDSRAGVEDDEQDPPSAMFVEVTGPSGVRRFEHRIVPGTDSPWRQAKIFYLISPRTASAAEHLASVFKGTGRATLIGETSAGAGNYGNFIDLPGGYGAFIPLGHSYFPGTKGWEGTGVAPDIAVAPERALVEALARAGVPAAEAETLSASHTPSRPMTRRPPVRP